jgi:16S rRNA (cytidine1402-2'-O)-methyltransferase
MSSGALVLVGTPIGNLGDLAPRAIEAFAAADAVACEDTRRTGRLLAHIGVRVPVLIVMNDHTEGDVIDGILGRLGSGERVVVVSDAGMPGISDPGERLVAAAAAGDWGGARDACARAAQLLDR